jgi:hypothetical protein
MLEPFFILLQNLPFGLLLAALLLETFIVAKNRREVEPAVLWLLFWSICASGIVIVVTLAMFFVGGDSSRLQDGFWGLAVVVVASLAWYFKRQGRDRGLLRLGELFYGPDPKEPPKAKPGQAFWILGWRTLAVASLVAGVCSLLRIKPGFSLSKYEQNATAAAGSSAAHPAATPPASPTTAGTNTAAAPAAQTPPPAASATTTTPPAEVPPAAAPAAAPAETDPTKAEIPTAEASEAAAKMAVAPEAATPVVTPPSAPPAEAVRPVSHNSAYFTKVKPILAKACIKCHGADKHKGDLALHTPDAIRAGANGKPVIVPGQPEKSELYKSIIKPQDDQDFMPSKGQPLSVTDKKTLYDWIKSGADLGDGVSIPGGGGGVFTVDNLSQGLQDVDQNLLESLTKAHIIIRPLSKNKRVVEVDFSHSDRMDGDLKLSELAPIALNIYTLDLSRTRVKDDELAALSGMKNLQTLILSKTDVTDAGVAHLKNNTSLEVLNLYQTMVTDAGLAGLSGLKALKKVFVWNSKITETGAKKFEGAVPGAVVNIGSMEAKVQPPPKPPAAPKKP